MAYGDNFKVGDRVVLNYPDDIHVHNREGRIVKCHKDRLYYVQLDNKVGVMAIDEQLNAVEEAAMPDLETGDYEID